MKNFVYDVREVRTIKELLETSVELFSNNNAFVFREGAKTYQDVYNETVWLSTYFNSLGLQNKKIAVIGRNCYEWALTYLAVTCGTGVIVPIDKELKPSEISNIVNISDAAAIMFTSDINKTIDDCEFANDPLKLSTDDLYEYLKKGKTLYNSGDLSYHNHVINPYKLGVLLFTSGTTGMAKGVMLSHYNICSNIVGIRKKVYADTNDRVLSVLPLHHTYECTAGFLTMLYSGASIAYAESLRKIVADVQFYSPTILIVVPLLLENIHKNLIKKAGKLKISVAKRVAVTKTLRNVIFKQIHETFGGKLRLLISGAAALSPEIAKDFASFGFTVYQGYGLTETSPVSLMHNDFCIDYNSVGEPVTGVDVQLANIDEDGIGEIIIKGSNVMFGYYNNPEETAKVLKDGWFYSGDMGTIGIDGNYRIVGRYKNVIVTKNGKNIYPEEMEYFLNKSPYIAESMIYGEDTDQDTIIHAVILPDYDAIKDASLNISIKELMIAAVKSANSNVPNYKAIRKFVVRQNEFDKTTTKKIKRNAEGNYDGELL